MQFSKWPPSPINLVLLLRFAQISGYRGSFSRTGKFKKSKKFPNFLKVRLFTAGCWGFQSTPGIWEFIKGARLDFCLLAVAITASTSGFEKLSTALVYISDSIPWCCVRVVYLPVNKCPSQKIFYTYSGPQTPLDPDLIGLWTS